MSPIIKYTLTNIAQTTHKIYVPIFAYMIKLKSIKADKIIIK